MVDPMAVVLIVGFFIVIFYFIGKYFAKKSEKLESMKKLNKRNKLRVKIYNVIFWISFAIAMLLILWLTWSRGN